MLILGSLFGKFSTEQPQNICQILLKVPDWRGYSGFETDCNISFTDKEYTSVIHKSFLCPVHEGI